jgi:nucleotide-binding universal stress UspA family protein
MSLRLLVAATDFSPEGRAAVLTARRLATATGAKVTALSVELPVMRDVEREAVVRRMDERLRAELGAQPGGCAVEPAVAFGFAGIEICRYAEDRRADLVVLGRKSRPPAERLIGGDTVDDVARRSRLPCLIVRDANPLMGARVLAALDGTERGLSVLLAAAEFTRAIEGRLRAITVEPKPTGALGDPSFYAKVKRMVRVVDLVRTAQTLGPAAWDPASGARGSPLAVHRGPIIEEVLREASAWNAGVLVVGCHRGGPAAVIDAGSVARRLAQEASCAVLTVPL